MTKPSSIAEDLHQVLEVYQAHKESQWVPYLEKCDQYYIGFRHNLVWPGTNNKRSNIKLHVAADISETMYSSIVHTLFYSGGENFFDTVSENIETAQHQTDRLRFLLHAPIDLAGRSSFWGMKRAVRYILRYGIGFLSIRYDGSLERPKVVPISPYDLIWSPTTGSFIDDSPKIFHRFFRSIKELLALQGRPGYRIPSKAVLEAMYAEGAEARMNNSDQAKRDAIAEEMDHSIGQQLIDEPSEKRLEVFRVSTATHLYWIIVAGQRQELIYAAPNRLETQPYTAGVFRPLLHGFGGVSLIKLLSGEHDLQQIITNSMLDGIDLSITPPTRQAPGTDKQIKWGPGMSFIGNNEKLNAPVAAPPFPPEAAQVYMESRQRMNRIAGTNEMAITGQARPGNANRTLGGMQLQDAAREQRSFGIIEEIESGLVVPTLLKMSLLDRSTASPGRALPALNSDREMNTVQPEQLPQQLHIEVRGATRMVGIARMTAVMEPMLRYVFNPQIQQEAMKVGQTIDFLQVDKFVGEALGTDRKFRFFRQATQEEAQMSQQGELQKAQIQAQSRAQSDQMRAKTQLALEQMKQAGLSDERALKILELLIGDNQALGSLKSQMLQGSADSEATSKDNDK